jgi:hypothetical protein
MDSHGLGDENFISGTGILLLRQEEGFVFATGLGSHHDSYLKGNESYFPGGKTAAA